MPILPLEFIVQAIPDLVFRFNRKGDFLHYYVTRNRLLAVPADQIIGKNLRDLFDQEIVEGALQCINEALEKRTETSFEYSLNLNNSLHFFEARMVPVQNLEVISFIRDVTDRHLLQVQNNELIKINSELDSFVYHASHDLRAPLSSILGLVEIGLRTGNPEEMRSCLTMIKERVQTQDAVIHEIIDYARNLRTDVKKEKLNLKFLVFEVIDTLLFNEGAEKIDFQIDIADDFEILSDKVRLNIILSNLISNSIKYHDYARGNPFVKVDVMQSDSKISIGVEDNGQGIHSDHHDKIFDMFYRASEKSKGSGLGLFIVKDTVEKLGGVVECSSRYNEGTRFTFSI
ncbi:hypothetical protein WSM22_20570 [Cytophagales bacterium WSM2-2]|nr:hypothetical protein WSM22_20570 [Cytophagales bacterium WSM2-2]